jgi:hypothetical protein
MPKRKRKQAVGSRRNEQGVHPIASFSFSFSFPFRFSRAPIPNVYLFTYSFIPHVPLPLPLGGRDARIRARARRRRQREALDIDLAALLVEPIALHKQVHALRDKQVLHEEVVGLGARQLEEAEVEGRLARVCWRVGGWGVVCVTGWVGGWVDFSSLSLCGGFDPCRRLLSSHPSS